MTEDNVQLLFLAAKLEPSQEDKTDTKEENGEPASSAADSGEDKKEATDEEKKKEQSDEGKFM